MSALKDQAVPKHISMKREDLDKWLSALRSGEYRQGSGFLRFGPSSAPRYCCLGVLQMALDGEIESEDSRDDELPSLTWLESHGISFYDMNGADNNFPFLPTLNEDAIDANDERVCLPNDDVAEHVYDFNAIADAIEATTATY